MRSCLLIRLAALPVALALALVSSGAHAGVYWTNGTSFGGPSGTVGNQIGRADLDGGDKDRSWLDIGTSALDLELHGGVFYWPAPGRIGKADQATGAVERTFVSLPEVGPGESACSFECDLVVHGEHLYWTDSLREHVGRVGLDGTGLDPEWMHLGPHRYPSHLASDGGALFVHVAGPTTDSLWRIDTASRVPQVLVPEAGLQVRSLAASGGFVYYGGSHDGPQGERGHIGRVSALGAGDDPDWFSPSSDAPADASWYPARLVVHGQHLYFSADYLDSLDSGAIGRVRLDGTAAQPRLITDQGDLFAPFGLAVDSADVPAPASHVATTKVRVATKQRLKRGRLRVKVKVAPQQGPVRAVVRGKIRGVRGRVPLRVATRSVASGARTTVTIRVAGKGRTLLQREDAVRRAVRGPRKVRVVLTVALTDSRGDRRKIRRSVRVVR